MANLKILVINADEATEDMYLPAILKIQMLHVLLSLL